MRLGQTEFDVAIVGAGVAGLTAAVALTRAGRSVTVIEARDDVGGRIRSVQLSDGGVIELGAQWWWPNEPLISELVDELGIECFPERLSDGVWRLEGYSLDTPAYRFVLGASELPRLLAAQLPAGAVQLANPVHEVRRTDSGSVRVDARRTTVTAAHVIMAVPPSLAISQITFRPGLTPAFRAVAESTPVFLGQIVKAIALYEKPFWGNATLPAQAEMSSSGPFFEVHEHSGFRGRPAALFGFAPASQFVDKSTAAVGTVFSSQLSQVFGPEAGQPSAVHICNWSRERYTSPPRDCPTVPNDIYDPKAFETVAADQIHWASTETATSSAGHIEGAIDAGRRAAGLLAGSDGT